MHAAIDIGNTRCKIGFFENGTLRGILKSIGFSEAVAAAAREKITHAIVSSVGADTSELEASLGKFARVYRLSYQLPLPILLNYATPETLGTDRIAGAAGAFHLNPGKNSLVIDVGSCITYDVVTKGGSFEGGAISPGVEMRLKAMHQFTARLPLIDKPEWSELPAKTTGASLMNGALFGTLAEIEGMIERFSERYEDLHVIMCGGGSKFFESNIKPPIFACSELVLIGLNSILMHNERN